MTPNDLLGSLEGLQNNPPGCPAPDICEFLLHFFICRKARELTLWAESHNTWYASHGRSSYTEVELKCVLY